MADSSIVLPVKADVKSAVSSLKSLSGVIKSVGKAAMGAFAVKYLKDFCQSCVETTFNLIEVETKLETVMKQRMSATDEEVKSIEDLAGAQTKLGIIGKGVTLAGAQQAATYLTQSDSLKTLIPALDDLLAQQKGVNATESDAVSIGNMMGKALMGQVDTLKDVGISFSDAQAEVLKYGTEQERVTMLSQVITDNVGHMNQALASTPSGQIAQLKNNFGGLKNIIGIVLGSFIVPVVKGLNYLVTYATQAVKTLAELLGFDLSGSALKAASSIGYASEEAQQLASSQKSIADSTSSVNALAKSQKNLATNTKKAGKEAKGALASFDELTTLSIQNDSDSGTSGTATPSTSSMSVPSMPTGTIATPEFDTKPIDKLTSKFKGLKKTLSEIMSFVKLLAVSFYESFSKAFSGIDFSKLLGSFKKIKDSIMDIAKGILPSFCNFLLSSTKSLGTVLGALSKLGISIASAIINGFSDFISKNKGRIIDDVSTIMNTVSTIFNNTSDIVGSLGNILSSFFNSEGVQATVTDCIDCIYTLIAETDKLFYDLISDTIGGIKKLIDDIKEPLTKALNNLAKNLSNCMSLVNTIVKDTLKTIRKMYDKYIKSTISNILEGIQTITKAVLDTWNNSVSPAIDNIIETLKNFWTNSLKPLFDKVCDFFGALCEDISEIWKKTIAPFVSFIVKNVIPPICNAIKNGAKFTLDTLDPVIKVIGHIIDALKGVVNFVTGVFTGNWKKAFGGLKDVVVAIFGTIGDILKAPFNLVISAINTVIRAINDISVDIPSWIPGIGGRHIGFDIDEIPKLANGAVIPPNQKFLALLGDQTRGTNIETPLSTMVEAFKTAISDTNIGTGKEIINNIYLDGKKIAKSVIGITNRNTIRSNGFA